VKSSKAQIQATVHRLPHLRFEDQKLTSFSGLVVFQALFERLHLKERLRRCFSHLGISPIFGRHLVVVLVIIHWCWGFGASAKCTTTVTIRWFCGYSVCAGFPMFPRSRDHSPRWRPRLWVTSGSCPARWSSKGSSGRGLCESPWISTAPCSAPRPMPKGPRSGSTRRKKARAVTIPCSARWRKLASFSISSTDPVMSTTQTGPLSS